MTRLEGGLQLVTTDDEHERVMGESLWNAFTFQQLIVYTNDRTLDAATASHASGHGNGSLEYRIYTRCETR